MTTYQEFSSYRPVEERTVNTATNITLDSILNSIGYGDEFDVIDEEKTEYRIISNLYRRPRYVGEEKKTIGKLIRISLNRVFASQLKESSHDRLSDLITQYMNTTQHRALSSVNREIRREYGYAPFSFEKVWVENGNVCILQIDTEQRRSSQPLDKLWTERQVKKEITARELRALVSTLSALMAKMSEHGLVHTRLEPAKIQLQIDTDYLGKPSVSLFLTGILSVRNAELLGMGLGKFNYDLLRSDTSALIWSSPELIANQKMQEIDIEAHNEFVTAQIIYWLISSQLPFMPDKSVSAFFTNESFDMGAISQLMTLTPIQLLRLRRQMTHESYPTSMPLAILYKQVFQGNTRTISALESLDVVFRQALNVDPKKRFSSISEMTTALLTALDNISDSDLTRLLTTEPMMIDTSLLKGSTADTIPFSTHTDPTETTSPAASKKSSVKRLIERLRNL